MDYRKKLTEGYDISFKELIALMIAKENIDLTKEYASLTNKGYMIEVNGIYGNTPEGNDIVDNIMNEIKFPDLEDGLTDLAKSLKEIFPKGRKEGTYYWSDGVILIKRRLRTFFKKYGNFDYEDIKEAARKYVASFNGQYKYMQLLKYFIFKESVGAGGDLEPKSELLNYLENNKEEQEYTNDWNANII